MSVVRDFETGGTRPRARGLARRDARRFDHVTLTRGAAALAVATSTLAVPFRPEANFSHTTRYATRAARRCHAKLVWLIELWSKRRASRLANPRARGRDPTCGHENSTDRENGWSVNERP